MWAAISGALTLLALLGLFLVRPQHWLWLSVVVVMFVGGVEAATRRRLADYLVTVTVFLAFVTGAILVRQFWQLIVFLAVSAVVVYVIVDNLPRVGKELKCAGFASRSFQHDALAITTDRCFVSASARAQ